MQPLQVTMQPLQVIIFCLALAFHFTFASAKENDINFSKFDDDYDLTSESNEMDGLEYELFNLTFSASGGREHERVKRWQDPLTSTNPNPLCIMTFNIRTYKAPVTVLARDKDIVISAVSYL